MAASQPRTHFFRLPAADVLKMKRPLVFEPGADVGISFQRHCARGGREKKRTRKRKNPLPCLPRGDMKSQSQKESSVLPRPAVALKNYLIREKGLIGKRGYGSIRLPGKRIRAAW